MRPQGNDFFIRLNLWFVCLFSSMVGITPMRALGAPDARPQGLPPLSFPANNLPTPAKISLGRELFLDKRLSADGDISCATCHDPQRAFSDGLPVAQGRGGRRGARNSPSLLNAAYSGSQFWDGRRLSLEEQANDPFVNAGEHGLTDHDSLLTVVRHDRRYGVAFKRAFGVASHRITMEHVAKAIASFERTLIAGDTPFDRYQYGGDRKALSEAAIRGLAIFQGRAKCQTCHRINSTDALFTDGEFHRLGVGHQRIEDRLAELAAQVAQEKKQDIGNAILSTPELSELGRFLVTWKPTDIGRFKTPSLRNVAVTGPYMHDGSVETLEGAVDREIYYRSLEGGRPLILTPGERGDLVEFLKSLTSPKFAGVSPTKPQIQAMH